jgi:hypothetical protein
LGSRLQGIAEPEVMGEVPIESNLAAEPHVALARRHIRYRQLAIREMARDVSLDASICLATACVRASWASMSRRKPSSVRCRSVSISSSFIPARLPERAAGLKGTSLSVVCKVR